MRYSAKVDIETDKTDKSISACVLETSKVLERFRVSGKTSNMFSIYLEELLLCIRDSLPEDDAKISVRVRKRLDEVSIRILARGERISLENVPGGELSSGWDLMDLEDSAAGTAISRRLLAAGMENIQSRYRSGTNEFRLYVKRSQYDLLKKVLLAMVFGIGTGLLMKLSVPPTVTGYISGNIFQTVTKMFMNAIKMIIGPMVFCSIASCISSYTDLSMLQKIGRNTIVHYFLNALFGMALAFGVCFLFTPGATGVPIGTEALAGGTVETSVEVQSIWETIGSAVPSNLFAAFHSSNILQLIFAATLFGAAIGQTGTVSAAIRDNIKALGKIFAKMTSFVMYFLPAMVFCSMAKMALEVGLDTVLIILYWLALIFGTYIAMIGAYALIVWARTKTKPSEFFKKIISCLMIAFSMGSSSASMSTTISTCEKDLKIRPEIYTFTVPLGVSIHSASSCMFYIISTVFLSNLYAGTDTLASLGLIFYFSVFMLAFGAPSVSGAGPICVATLLSSIGVPMEYIALILAWDPIVSTIKTCCSCMEDLSVAYMVDHELK